MALDVASPEREGGSAFDGITLEILWSRLIAVVDETAATLLRTSFSTTVRESNDFACVLLDADGNSLAQSTLSIPSFIGTLPRTVRHVMREFPVRDMRPGDCFMTNDPWLGTGHLNDINVVMPLYYQGRHVGFSASVAHSPDIGGKLRSPENREIYEEGLRLLPCRLLDGGRVNAEVMHVVRANVRTPDHVVGDLMAQVAANRLAGERLFAIMEEYRLRDLHALATEIEGRSERAMRQAIAELPDGTFEDELEADGYDGPLTIHLRLTVEGDTIACDYAGTAPQVDRALNVVPTYTFAYTAFPLKCVLHPRIPNNEGCFRPISVTAPEGSLLNPRYPAACGARASIGHYLPVLVLGALAKLVPERVQAASGSPMWSLQFAGARSDGGRYSGVFFFNGGQGASQGHDGISCLSFPSNLSNTPAEVVEHILPVAIWCKELEPDSGGAGEFTGGCGQRLEVELRSQGPATLTFMSSRTIEPAPGLFGGHPGALGQALVNGQPVNPKQQRTIRPGDRITVVTPGGGGFGDPRRRDRAALARDLRNGLITPEKARSEYGAE